MTFPKNQTKDSLHFRTSALGDIYKQRKPRIYRHGQPNPDSHSTMRVRVRLPMSVLLGLVIQCWEHFLMFKILVRKQLLSLCYCMSNFIFDSLIFLCFFFFLLLTNQLLSNQSQINTSTYEINL